MEGDFERELMRHHNQFLGDDDESEFNQVIDDDAESTTTPRRISGISSRLSSIGKLARGRRSMGQGANSDMYSDADDCEIVREGELDSSMESSTQIYN